jgi:hypothetical protein
VLVNSLNLPLWAQKAMSQDDEEVLKPDLIGMATKEGQEVRQWQPPGPKQKQLKTRIFEIELWVQNRGWTEEEEIIAYSMRRWDVDRQTARRYVAQVVEDFKRSGVPVLGS